MKSITQLLLMFVLTVTTSMLTAQQPASIRMDVNNVDMSVNGNGSCESNTLANSGLWLSGLDIAMQMVSAFASDLTQGNDFSPGPLTMLYGYSNDEIREAFNRVWSVHRWELDLFLSQFDENGNYNPQPGYHIPTDILEWPAHGPILPDENHGGFAEYLAPFVDVDGDGRYDPYHGDYPEIKGDQCAFFVFNTRSSTHFTSGYQVGLEIQGMAYAFDEPGDDLMNNTIFFDYKLINRSTYYLSDFYVGYWCDFEIGFKYDDYVGCNVENNCFYAYNAGVDPPSQVVTLLKGIQMDNGDGRFDLTNFMYYTGENTVYNNYYFYQRSLWDSQYPLQYGGNGHIDDRLSLPLDCKYAFPGISDPQNIGTNGTAPWGYYTWESNAEIGWTEGLCGNPPGDRRGVGSMGPISLTPGDILDFDIALTTFPDRDAVWQLDEPLNHLRYCYETGWTASGKPFAYYHDVNENTVNQDVMIYPNPSSGVITIKMTDFQMVDVYDILGRKLISSHETIVDLSGLPQGVYLAKVFNGKGFCITRPVVLTTVR